MTPKFPTGKPDASRIPDNKAPTSEKTGGAATGTGSMAAAVNRVHQEVHKEGSMKDWSSGMD